MVFYLTIEFFSNFNEGQFQIWFYSFLFCSDFISTEKKQQEYNVHMLFSIRNTKAMKMKQEAYRNTKEIQKLWKWNKKLIEIPKKYKSYENETRSL